MSRPAVVAVVVAVLAGAAWWWLRPDGPTRTRPSERAARTTPVDAVKPLPYSDPAQPLPTIEEALQATPGAREEHGRRRVFERGQGRVLDIELIDPPALSYGQSQWSDADHVYANAVRPIPRVSYDPLLGHAARELAYLYSVEDGLVPSGALEFVLLSAGAAEWGVRQSLTGTSSEEFDVIAERVTSIVGGIPGSGPIRVGIGEAYEPGARPPRTIAIVASTGQLIVDPVRKQVDAKSRIRVTGTLPPGTKAPRAVVMWPDLEVSNVAVQSSGRRFTMDVSTGERPGELWAELIADTDLGPKPLAQLVFYVQQDVPLAWRGGYPPDESRYQTPQQCATRAYELVDADRREHGLPALQRSAALDTVARAHAEDMRDNGFFGHVSPRTGSVSDRVARAGLRMVTVGENVARNSSLFDAEQGLMWSLGHRVNILSRRYREVGLGVAITEPKAGSGDSGKRTFHVVQVFGTSTGSLRPEETKRDVLRAIAEARAAAEMAPIRVDSVLATHAGAEARAKVATPAGALERASDDPRVSGRLYAWVSGGWDPESPQLPEAIYDDTYERVGVAVFVDESDGEAPLRIVAILAGP